MDIADLIGIMVLIFTPIVAVGTVQMLVDHRERKQKVKEEIDKMWNRIEWLCRMKKALPFPRISKPKRWAMTTTTP